MAQLLCGAGGVLVIPVNLPVHFRVISLDSMLRPSALLVSLPATFETFQEFYCTNVHGPCALLRGNDMSPGSGPTNPTNPTGSFIKESAGSELSKQFRWSKVGWPKR